MDKMQTKTGLALPSYAGPRCASGRTVMSLIERQIHFAYCKHPECLFRMAVYEALAERVREEFPEQTPPAK